MAEEARASDVGARYAQALFDLAVEKGDLARVEGDLKGLGELITASPDLRALLRSPKFSAEDKGRGLAAVADKAGFGEITRKFLGLVARNGRAQALDDIVRAFRALAEARRGAVSALVTTAVPLTDAQREGVAAALRTALGKDPRIETRVDPAILGGLKVRVGSRLYDASLKSKLDSLKFALKRA